MNAWQRGFDLPRLRAVSALFAAHDRGLCLGAFTKVNERRAADWLAAGQLRECDGVAAAVVREAASRHAVRDYTGAARAEVRPGDLVVERFACRPGAEPALLALLQGLLPAPPRALWLQSWLEHATDRALCRELGLQHVATKVRAGSELIGCWGFGAPAAPPLPQPERLALARLALAPAAVLPLAEALAAALERLRPAYAPHYSSYNERGSWSALALRGFGGDARTIEKPAEMSKQWKAAHPKALALRCADTALRAELPEAEPLLALLPARFERVRLMALAPGGALSRHADVTDHDAGTGPGKLLRIHFALQTNEACRFTAWRQDGRQEHAVMRCGEAWYLDTRKPHAAVNGGQRPRVHLVCDCWASPALAALLGDDRPAPEPWP